MLVDGFKIRPGFKLKINNLSDHESYYEAVLAQKDKCCIAIPNHDGDSPGWSYNDSRAESSDQLFNYIQHNGPHRFWWTWPCNIKGIKGYFSNDSW